ncbi:MAG: lipoyl(octanoyl) transferase LipB [Acidiferrobacterales bacterium]
MQALDGVIVRDLGRVDYLATWRAMREFTERRDPSTNDEIWLLMHPRVYTIGLKGRDHEFVSRDGISFVRTDRGGDMTYHGPGQIVAYVLMDLQRRRWGVRQLVHGLEQAVIELLVEQGIEGHRRCGAPGVYVEDKKIAALGLRVRRGRSYHGLALNVDMDLTPFAAIDPCGYPGMDVTQLLALAPHLNIEQTNQLLMSHLITSLGYNAFDVDSEQPTPKPASGY